MTKMLVKNVHHCACTREATRKIGGDWECDRCWMMRKRRESEDDLGRTRLEQVRSVIRQLDQFTVDEILPKVSLNKVQVSSIIGYLVKRSEVSRIAPRTYIYES